MPLLLRGESASRAFSSARALFAVKYEALTSPKPLWFRRPFAGLRAGPPYFARFLLDPASVTSYANDAIEFPMDASLQNLVIASPLRRSITIYDDSL